MPPGDGINKFHFPQGKLVLHGGNFEELVKNIFDYRLRQNIEIGDIEREVNDFYCSRYPSFCHPETGEARAASRPAGESMLNRVSRWAAARVHNMPRGGYALVVLGEAERRAVICASCPKNIGWRGGCGGCSASTLALLQQVKQLRKTKYDGTLSACGVAGFENGCAIWLPTSATTPTPEQRAAMPEACWRKVVP